ncbi:hypothetical protein Esti_003538 [Eimeria stiedai]
MGTPKHCRQGRGPPLDYTRCCKDRHSIETSQATATATTARAADAAAAAATTAATAAMAAARAAAAAVTAQAGGTPTSCADSESAGASPGKMEGPLGAPGLLGALEEAADVQRAKELLMTADLIAADAGASGCLVSRWGPLLFRRARGFASEGPLGGPPSVPRICQLEGFKELQRRQQRRQLRTPPQQQQHKQQQQLLLLQQVEGEQEVGVPQAETAVVFVSSFLDKALPSVEALVDLLPRLRALTLCCFYSENQQRWHSRCMQQQHSVSLQRVVAALLQRRGEGFQSRSGAPGGPLPLSVETLHTPLHANPFTANSFFLTAGAGAPLLTDDSARRLLAEAAAEERLLQRRSAATNEMISTENHQVGLEDLSVENLPLQHRASISSCCCYCCCCCCCFCCCCCRCSCGKALSSPAASASAAARDFFLDVAAAAASAVLVSAAAAAAAAAMLAECCFWWGSSSASVHCSGAAARLLGRAVAERIPPKSRRSRGTAAASAGVRGTSAEAAAENQEVLLLIVDRQHSSSSSTAAQQHPLAPRSSSSSNSEAQWLVLQLQDFELLDHLLLFLLDLQSPLASGGFVSPLAPPDGGVAVLQQLAQQQQQQQKQSSSISCAAGCRGLGMIGDFPRLSLLLSCAGGGPHPDEGAPEQDSRTEEAPAAPGASVKVANCKQQQQQHQHHGAACSAQSYVESGRLRCFFAWGPQAHRELFLAAASVGPSLSGWHKVASALSAAFEAHGVGGVDPPRAFAEGNSSSSKQQRRTQLLLLLLRLLQRTCEQDSSWGRRLSALQDRLALWPLLEFVEELLLPCLLADEPIESVRLFGLGLVISGAVCLWLFKRVGAQGPDACFPERQCMRRSGKCCCWECLLAQLSKASSSSSSSKASAVAARLWSVQQARAALSANRNLPPAASWGLRGLQRDEGGGRQEGPPSGREGGACWLLNLARGLRDTPGEAFAYSDAPAANAPLLEGILNQGFSTFSFLWGVARTGAEAVAGRERLSLKTPQTVKRPPKRIVLVFVLGGVALHELEAFGAFRGAPHESAGATQESDFLIGSTALTSPACLASQLFDDLITEPHAS